MVGEIRDCFMFEVAIEASLIGYLVLLTLHTNSVVVIVMCLFEMGFESYLLASSVIGILA